MTGNWPDLVNGAFERAGNPDAGREWGGKGQEDRSAQA